MKHRINPAILGRAVPIDLPVPYGRNPRKGDVEKIAKSLVENGQYKPITLRTGTNEVLAGNHTLKAARSLGWDQVAVEYVECRDDHHAAQIVLVDNAASDWAAYDLSVRRDLIMSLPDPSYGSGYSGALLEAALTGGVQEPVDTPDGADTIEQLPEAVRTQPGDVWELGPHRLICGDSTDPRVLEELLGGERPHLMWTDPPYGVDYAGGTKPRELIENDTAGSLAELLAGAFGRAQEVLRPGAPVYVAHADAERVTFEQAMRGAGFIIRQNLIWVKDRMTFGRADYHWRHEPVMMGSQPGDAEPDDDVDVPDNVLPLFEDGKGHGPLLYGFAPGGSGRLGRGGPYWYGTHNRTTVFEFPKPPSSVEHPTMKPVGLISAHLANSILRGSGRQVLDPFAGSGSTMMACDLHGVQARMVELAPAYCDVIAMRWQKHSGEDPVLNGRPQHFPVKAAG